MKTLSARVWTDKELLALPKERGEYELIDGQLCKMSPPKAPHGFIAVRIAAALQQHVAPQKLGLVFNDTGFRLDSHNVLAPDVSYSSMDRLRRENSDLKGFVRGVPDLAVEIISPSERRGKTLLKMEKYFAQGTRLVWLVYPKREDVEVYTSPNIKTLKCVGEELDGGEVLPGFRLPLAEIFADWF